MAASSSPAWIPMLREYYYLRVLCERTPAIRFLAANTLVQPSRPLIVSMTLMAAAIVKSQLACIAPGIAALFRCGILGSIPSVVPRRLERLPGLVLRLPFSYPADSSRFPMLIALVLVALATFLAWWVFHRHERPAVG